MTSRILPIAELAPKIRRREIRPSDLVAECLDKIGRYDSRIKAWVLVDEEGAKRRAAELERELQAGKYRGPLHGIPLGIKDIVDMAGFPTEAGSPLLKGNIAAHDAPVVQRLREAGAILIGKTVTTEFASFDPPPTRNPWNLQRTPGGSSSGSAAGVALGMCAAAIGSQTGGSITRPAAFCGIAGCKPSIGRVPADGFIPLSLHLDHPGPMARTVTDLAIVLRAIIHGRPESIAAQFGNDAEGLPDLSRKSPPRLGIVREYFLDEADPEMVQAVELAAETLRRAGAEVVPFKLPDSFAEVRRHHRCIMCVEGAQRHRRLFLEHQHQFSPHIKALLEDGLATPVMEYAQAIYHQFAFRQEIKALMQEVDALLTPATVGGAPPTDSTGDPRMNAPWSYSGLPTVSFPCALTKEGLPLSLQLVGQWREDAQLLRVARWCEKQLPFEAQPGMLET